MSMSNEEIINHFRNRDRRPTTNDGQQALAIEVRRYAAEHGRQMRLGEAMCLVDEIVG
jgi:hypothetical protein